MNIAIASDEAEIKSGDYVLVRNSGSEQWVLNIFSHTNVNFSNYVVIGGHSYSSCIPFNGNEHLVGRIESYKTMVKELSPNSPKQEKEPLSEKDIKHIEYIVSKITQGTWTLYYEKHEGPKVYGIHNGSYSNGGTFEEIIPAVVTEDSYSCDGREYGILNPDDALFIVNAPEYVKSLINEVKYLKNRLSAVDNNRQFGVYLLCIKKKEK